jgi:ribosomal protein L19E
MCGELPPASEVKNLSMVATWPTDIILTDNMEDATMTPEEVKQLIADETKEYKDKITALEAQVAAAKQKDGKGQEGGEKAGDGENRTTRVTTKSSPRSSPTSWRLSKRNGSSA